MSSTVISISIMVLFEIYQRLKGQFLNELRVSFKLPSVLWNFGSIQLFKTFKLVLCFGI